MMRFFPLMMFSFFVVVAYFVLTSPQHSTQQQLMTGKIVPHIRLPELGDSETKPLSLYAKNKPVMINVFASWCAPCRHEIAPLLRLQERKLLPIIGIAWKDKNGDAEAMLGKYGNPYSIVLNDSEGSTTVPLALTGVPETFIVGADGVILYHSKDRLSDEIIQHEILPLLEGKR